MNGVGEKVVYRRGSALSGNGKSESGRQVAPKWFQLRWNVEDLEDYCAFLFVEPKPKFIMRNQQ